MIPIPKLKRSLRSRIKAGRKLIERGPIQVNSPKKPYICSESYEAGFKLGTVMAFDEVLRILEQGK